MLGTEVSLHKIHVYTYMCKILEYSSIKYFFYSKTIALIWKSGYSLCSKNIGSFIHSTLQENDFHICGRLLVVISVHTVKIRPLWNGEKYISKWFIAWMLNAPFSDIVFPNMATYIKSANISFFQNEKR